MKTIFSKILVSVLSVIVVFSTFSFTVDGHYCGNRLVKFAIFTQADSCNDNMESGSEDAEDIQFSKEPCCKNITKIIEGKELDTNKVAQKIIKKQQLFLTTYLYTYLDFDSKSESFIYKDYSEPLLKVNRTILFENFRI